MYGKKNIHCVVDGTAELVSRDHILRRERGQGNINFPCSSDHVQEDGNLTRLIHTLAICVTIHTYIHAVTISVCTGTGNVYCLYLAYSNS